MSFEFSRNLRDKEKEVTATLAQAGVNSPAIDLEQANGGDIEDIVAQVTLPVVPGITDGKVLTFALEDSADGVNFAPVDPAVTTTAAGAGGNGSPSKDVRFRFPPVTRQYVRIAQTAQTSSGTFTGALTFRLLF